MAGHLSAWTLISTGVSSLLGQSEHVQPKALGQPVLEAGTIPAAVLFTCRGAVFQRPCQCFVTANGNFLLHSLLVGGLLLFNMFTYKFSVCFLHPGSNEWVAADYFYFPKRVPPAAM